MFPGSPCFPGSPPYVTQFPPLTPLRLRKKFQSCGGRNLVTTLHPEPQGCHRPHKKEGSEVPTRTRGNFWGFHSRGKRLPRGGPSPPELPKPLGVDWRRRKGGQNF